MTCNISLFILYMIYNFSKCDGFTVFWIISIKYCGIKFIASPLQPWKFGTIIALKNSKLSEG